jgi:mannose-6-phosphate isomerase-like protein (cupin superfamily)
MTDAGTARPYVRRDGEGEALWLLGNLVTVKATGADTRGRLTVVEFVNPPGYAPPLHRHRKEDEIFYLLSGTAEFVCDGEIMPAEPGDMVMLPVGLPHAFVVGPAEPLRMLQITSPAGFEGFAATAGEAAGEHRLPDPAPVDIAAVAHAAAVHDIEIVGPPPSPSA